jgi:hypothetical protein
VRWHTEAAVTAWTGDEAHVRLLGGRTTVVEADALVLATTNRPDDALAHGLTAGGIDHHVVGDAVAARLAVHAIYEARAMAQAI